MQLAAAEANGGEKGKGQGKTNTKNKGKGKGRGGKGKKEKEVEPPAELEEKSDNKKVKGGGKASKGGGKGKGSSKKPKTVEPEPEKIKPVEKKRSQRKRPVPEEVEEAVETKKIQPVEKKRAQRKRPIPEEVEEVEESVVEGPKQQRQPKKHKVEPSSSVNPKGEDGSAARVLEDIKLKVGALRNDSERWTSFNALYNSMMGVQPTCPNDVPKYKHYSLSMYWTKARVGLLQGKHHCLSFSSASTMRIGLPLCATKLYVACWRGSPFCFWLVVYIWALWTLIALGFLSSEFLMVEPQPQSDFFQPMIQLRWSKRVVMSMILSTRVLALLNAVLIWTKWSICVVSWSGWRFHCTILHLRVICETSGQESFQLGYWQRSIILQFQVRGWFVTSSFHI